MIHIIREAIAESDNPVMLYSVGKDSSVLLHLALKAFYPANPPFPLLHIDTTWKFRDMIAFRDRRAAELGLNLIVHINQEGLARGIDPEERVGQTGKQRFRHARADIANADDRVLPVFADRYVDGGVRRLAVWPGARTTGWPG